jgi:hypothetical protein
VKVSDFQLAEQHEGLTNTVATLWLGRRFAEQRIERTEDRERLMALLRHRLCRRLRARAKRSQHP